jgi:hypothetical protein
MTSDLPTHVEPCPHCGQRNRVQSGTVRSGRCREPFVVVSEQGDGREIGANRESQASGGGPDGSDAGYLKQAPAGAGGIGHWIEAGVPRDPDQIERLLAERPHCWEFLLLAAMVLRYKVALEPQWIDHDNGIGRVSHAKLDVFAAMHILSDRIGLMGDTLRQEMRVLDPEATRRALGGPQEPGDPQRIERIADHIASGYAAMLDWAAELRGLRAPEEMRPVLEAAARLADQPIAQVRTWIDHLVEAVDALPGRVATGNNAYVDATLTLSIDPTVLAAFQHCVEKLTDAHSTHIDHDTAEKLTLRRTQLNLEVEAVELQLRDIVRERLRDSRRLPSHVGQKVADRLRIAARRQPGIEYLKQPTLAVALEYVDLRELLDTITAKSLWSEFEDIFGTKEQLNTRFDQLAELRNALRHSRTMIDVTIRDGQAAILWFRQVLGGAQEAPDPGDRS